MKYLIVAFFVFVSLFSLARAHGTGLTFDKTVGEYNIDIDADAEELVAGQPIRFDFKLWDKDRTQQIDSDSAWVRITQDGNSQSLFAGQIGKPGFGSMGMSYAFSKPGSYELSVRFQKKGKDMLDQELAEASFPLTIEGAQEEKTVPKVDEPKFDYKNSVSGLILGLVIGAGVTFLLRGKNKSQNN